MHRFTDLADGAAAFAIRSLNQIHDQTMAALQTSGETIHVKNLQMIRLSKAIFAVGMFSIFEAMLQDNRTGINGFKEVRKLLISQGEGVLEARFVDYYRAINVLKHGEGESYQALVAKKAELPFTVITDDENAELQYDVSNISTLGLVFDAFVEGCGQIIRDVTIALRRTVPALRL